MKIELEDKNLFEMLLEDTDEDGLYALSLVDKPAMKSHWLALGEQEKPKDIKFQTIDEAQRIVLGAILIPDMPVYRDWNGGLYIYFSEDTIRKSREVAMKKGMNTFTIQHEKPVPNIHLLETWIVEDTEKDKSAVYGLEYKKGTWVASLKINNDEVWDNFIATGELSGFSIEGLFKMADKPEGELSDDDFLDAVKSALSV